MIRPAMIVGLDFDGTVVGHEYPGIGEDLGAVPYLLQAQEEFGARYVLFTMRDGAELQAAAKHLTARGVELLASNVNPTQHKWTMSPKAYCHLYVDDSGLGIPLKETSGRPAVDWERAGPMFMEAVRVWCARHGEPLKDSGRYLGEKLDLLDFIGSFADFHKAMKKTRGCPCCGSNWIEDEDCAEGCEYRRLLEVCHG